MVGGGGVQFAPEPLGGGEAAGEKPDRGALDIAFAPGDLPGEAQTRRAPEAQPRVEQARRIEEGVAVQAAEPRELGPLQPRNEPEHMRLLAVFQLGLEPHHVEQRAERVVLAQLHDGVGFDVWIVRVGEADGLHRPVAQGLAAAYRHHLDRQAAVEIGRALEFAKLGLFGGEQRVDEGFVAIAAQRAIDVVGARAAGAGLVVARLRPGDRHVDRIAMDDRRDGVEERQRVLAGQGADRGGEGRRSQRPGGDDDAVPIVGRGSDFAALDANVRIAGDRRLDRGGKAVAIDRQRAAGGHLVGVGGAHDQRTKRAHLAVDDADRVVQRVVGTERIGADELGEALGAVRFGAAQRAHFVQDDGDVGLGDLPSRLAAGEPAADDVNGAHEGLSQSRAASSTAGGAGRRSKRKRPPGEDRRAFVRRA